MGGRGSDQIFYALALNESHTTTATRPTRRCSRRSGCLNPRSSGATQSTRASSTTSSTATTSRLSPNWDCRPPTNTPFGAPTVPHALHMPSHTFTRVGSWQESIDTNVASAKSAKALGSVAEELHAMDYQAYAALQTGQDATARALLAELPGIKARFDPEAIGGAAPGSAGLFALASMPARYALERGDWKAAAALTPEPNRFLYPEAQTWFAQGARRGPQRRRRDDQGGDRRADADPRRADREEGGLLGRAGRDPAALGDGMAGARRRPERRGPGRDDGGGRSRGQDREGGGDAGPAGAGARAGRRDAAADGASRPQALQAFEATLKKEPNRFRALSGAIRAATLAGQTDKARQHAQTLLKVCAKADAPARPELAEAKKLASSASR